MIYLSSQLIIDIHDELLRATGIGLQGIRDRGLIDSISNRPQNPEFQSIYSKASVLTEGLARFHPFNDCNKRTALICCSVFLNSNNILMSQTGDSLDKILQIANGELSLDEYSLWLESCTVSIISLESI